MTIIHHHAYHSKKGDKKGTGSLRVLSVSFPCPSLFPPLEVVRLPRNRACALKDGVVLLPNGREVMWSGPKVNAIGDNDSYK